MAIKINDVEDQPKLPGHVRKDSVSRANDVEGKDLLKNEDSLQLLEEKANSWFHPVVDKCTYPLLTQHRLWIDIGGRRKKG